MKTLGKRAIKRGAKVSSAHQERIFGKLMRAFTLALIVTVCGAEDKQLIELLVRGDDMGHALDLNEAFIQAHTEGILTSASVMAPTQYFDDAITRCKAHPKMAPGVHVTLMAIIPMRPVSPPEQVPSLIAPDGFFHRGHADFIKGNPKIEEVEREVRAQIQKCIASGLHFVYLDWHMSSNGGKDRPDIGELLQRLSSEYKLLYTHSMQDWDGQYSGAKYFAASLESWDSQRLPDGQLAYWCKPFLPEETRLKFLETLRTLTPGTWYTVCHPGLYAPRQAESVALICSQEVKDIIRERNIRLISYADLQQRKITQKAAPSPEPATH